MPTMPLGPVRVVRTMPPEPLIPDARRSSGEPPSVRPEMRSVRTRSMPPPRKLENEALLTVRDHDRSELPGARSDQGSATLRRYGTAVVPYAQLSSTFSLRPPCDDE